MADMRRRTMIAARKCGFVTRDGIIEGKASMQCSDCHVPLVRGYVYDRGQPQDGVADWVEGAPEPGIIFALVTRNRLRLPIEGWRCPDCGKLSLYAREATDM